jgi:hypothetical protein
MGEMGELCKSLFMYKGRYCRGKLLKKISLHVLELKKKEGGGGGGVCV